MDVLTTEQAAARLGITPTRVRFFIRDGRLPARKFGRAHLINEADLRLVADRKPGRPRRGRVVPVNATKVTAPGSTLEPDEL